MDFDITYFVFHAHYILQTNLYSMHNEIFHTQIETSSLNKGWVWLAVRVSFLGEMKYVK